MSEEKSVMKAEKKITLVDTAREVDIDEVNEYLETHGREPVEEDSDAYWDVAGYLRNWDWEDFKDNVKYSSLNNEQFLITGTLGLWNGSPTIIPVLENSLEEAINRCISGSTMDIEVEFDNGHLNVYCSHHDGTNCFEIYRLSYLGKKEVEKEKYYYQDLPDKEWMHGKIKLSELW